jgi:hypothetical protein
MSLEVTETVNSAYLWMLVCEQLKWHNKGTHQCIDTLNRLWGKHSEVKGPNGEVLLKVPVLSEQMLTVRADLWSLSKLNSLKRSHTRNMPQFFPPIIVLRWFDRDFLIDGTTRVNFWNWHNNEGPHHVLIIAEKK